MTNYINIKSLNSQQTNNIYDESTEDQLKNLYENCIEVYQVQAIKDTSYANILKVGVMVEVNDVLIKELPLLDKYKLYLISKLYDYDRLKNLYQAQMIPMIQGNITYEDKPYGSVFFNFCPSESDISTEMKKIHGKFTITFHFQEDEQNKYVELNTSETFCGNHNMMNKIVEYTLKELI